MATVLVACLVTQEAASAEQEGEEDSLDKALKLRLVVDCSMQEDWVEELVVHCFRHQPHRVSVAGQTNDLFKRLCYSSTC